MEPSASLRSVLSGNSEEAWLKLLCCQSAFSHHQSAEGETLSRGGLKVDFFFPYIAALLSELNKLLDDFSLLFKSKDIGGMVAFHTKDCKIISSHENYENESGIVGMQGRGQRDLPLLEDPVEVSRTFSLTFFGRTFQAIITYN